MSEGTPLHGDRSAWDATAFGGEHAVGIRDSVLQRHLPLPGAAGGYARSDGTDWQRVSEIPLADIASYAQGSIIYGGAADWEALAVGGANAFLTTDGADVAWSTGLLSITAAKTLTVSNSLTLAGTDAKTLTLTDSLTVEGGNAGTLHFDAAATVTVSASCTINDWFDQSVKQAASPTHADVFVPDGGTIGIAGNELLTFNAAGTAVFSGCDVGIGIVPTEELDILGTVRARTASGVSAIQVYNTAVNKLWAIYPLTAGAQTGIVFYEADPGADRVVFAAGGRVGIGTTGPQGLLHGYDTISGFLHWEYDGVDGTARTVIPNAAGDVVYVLRLSYICRASDGEYETSTVSVDPGAAVTIYDFGGDTCTLAVAADGSVTVQRTAGALTYKVALWLLWI